MNIENIKKVRDLIADLDDGRFDMTYLVGKDGREYSLNRKGTATALKDCGTAACIAGWTNAIFAPRKTNCGSRQAGEALGLTSRAATRLFCPTGFDNPAHRDFFSKRRAVAVLDHLMATGVVDWSIDLEPATLSGEPSQ